MKNYNWKNVWIKRQKKIYPKVLLDMILYYDMYLLIYINI